MAGQKWGARLVRSPPSQSLGKGGLRLNHGDARSVAAPIRIVIARGRVGQRARDVGHRKRDARPVATHATGLNDALARSVGRARGGSGETAAPRTSHRRAAQSIMGRVMNRYRDGRLPRVLGVRRASVQVPDVRLWRRRSRRARGVGVPGRTTGIKCAHAVLIRRPSRSSGIAVAGRTCRSLSDADEVRAAGTLTPLDLEAILVRRVVAPGQINLAD